MSGTIVLGFDGSDHAKAALAEAARIAAKEGADVIVVFAYYISPLGGGDVRDYKAALEKVAAHETARAVADLEDAGVTATARHVSGKPADALLAVAQEAGATMIVVGSGTRHPLTAALLGSAVLSLVQRAPVPLLVVPG